MKDNSIRQTLPRLVWMMIVLLTVLILPANIWLQSYMKHESQRESSYEVFAQLKQLIEMSEKDLEHDKKDFSEKCIQAADMAAYFVQHYPEAKTDLEHTRKLAEKLQVDEIHYITPEGEVYFGTHPEYYGFTFRSGEQMEFFLPMLEDKTMKLCQEIMPNTAEGKMMQYAAVWLGDGSGIVQIGMEPKRIMKEIKDRSLSQLVESMPMDFRGYIHIVNKDTGKVEASTAEQLLGQDMSHEIPKNAGLNLKNEFHYSFQGKKFCVYTEEYRDYELIRTYFSEYPMHEILVSTAMVLLYIGVVAAVIIVMIVWYVDKKLARNLTSIVEELRKIEDGHLENVALKTNIKEFDELIFYVNQLMKSIRLNWNKMSFVIDKGRLPIGIFEYNTFYKKTFVNERLLNILGFEDQKRQLDDDKIRLIQETLQEAEKEIVNPEESVCPYVRNGKKAYLRIVKVTDEQNITYFVTDVSIWWEEIHSLREQSRQDLLSGLLNRRGFHEQLEQLFEEPEKLGYGAMIVLDADGLKKINDLYGHHVGDEYLKEIANAVRNSSGEHAVSGRLGGDEFAVFLYRYDSFEDVKNAVAELSKKRGNLFLSENMRISESLEFSMGCAYYPKDGENYHMLMHLADGAMYQEKRSRKES